MKLPDSLVDWFHTAYVRPANPDRISIFVCHGVESNKPYCYINKIELGHKQQVVPHSNTNSQIDDLPSLLRYRLLLPSGQSYLSHYALVRATNENGDEHNRSFVYFQNPEEIQELLEEFELR